MQVKVIEIKCGRSDEFRIVPFGDQHLGTQHCREEVVNKTVKSILSTPNTYWVGMGDYGEFITPKDPRWDSGGIAEWVDPEDIAYSLEKRIVATLEPIKSRCIGMLSGNHEDSYTKYNDGRVHKHICEKLGVTDLGFSCFVKFVFIRGINSQQNYTGYFTHGAGCAVTAGAKLIRLQRTMDNFEADIVAHAHVHDILTYEKPYLKLDNTNRIRHTVRVGAMTGCYFSTYTQDVSPSYGERKNYPPTTIGSPVFIVKPFKNEVRVENR